MRTYYRIVSIVGLACLVPMAFNVPFVGFGVGYALGAFAYRVWLADEETANA